MQESGEANRGYMVRPQKTSNSSSARYLVYVVSTLCAAGLAFSVLRILLPSLRVVIPVVLGWWLWRRFQNVQKTQQNALNAIFYQLIQDHQGRITVLDFAMMAKLPAATAREFLDARAKEFSAHFEVTEQGDTFYVFRTLKSYHPQPLTLEQKSPESTAHQGKQSIASEPLTQAKLAKRLGVSAGAIRRKKFSPDLAEWSKARDPDGICWMYLVQSRRFFAVEDEIKGDRSPSN